jgi:hypothetical protein
MNVLVSLDADAEQRVLELLRSNPDNQVKVTLPQGTYLADVDATGRVRLSIFETHSGSVELSIGTMRGYANVIRSSV